MTTVVKNQITPLPGFRSPEADNVRWFYDHILEHFSGRYGQILLLKHLRRAAG